jgi:geranylgeranyl diphosphate synthase, type II
MLSAIENASVKKKLQDAFLSQMQFAPDTEYHLAGALRETIGRPGSMVRAELAYRSGLSSKLGGDRSECLAISIEYFHTASLLFDDLPYMDNAMHRRGHVCVHHVFGEGAAILAALALINRAYALLWKATAELKPELQSHVLQCVERHLGVAGVLNGQSQDLYYSSVSPVFRIPQRVALGKTVPLIRLALILPALIGDVPERETRQLCRLAVSWGLGYQTLDDLKDILHSPEQGGKTVARDAHLDRPNMAIMIGVNEAFRYLDRLMEISGRIVLRLIRGKASLAFLQAFQEQFAREIATLSESRQSVTL